MTAPSPRLEITDGDTGVLLNGRVGFKLKEWRPGRIGADGMVEEVFVFTVLHWDQNKLIQWCRDVDALLQKSVNYWDSNWQPEPVYLVAKGPQETHTRYATIRSYAMGSATNPYGKPFINALLNVSMDDMTLTVVHLPWREFAPGRDTTDDGELKLTTLQDFGGTDFGHEYGNTGDWSHIVANKQLETNLTHIKRFDSVAVPPNDYTDILGAPPYGLLPDPVKNGDMCYFGIETAVLGFASAPFQNLIFDVSAMIVYGGNATAVWEFWNGLAWVAWPANTLQDNTYWRGGALDQPFSVDTYDWHANVSTVMDVWWNPSAQTWATVAVNGVTGWWVRLRAIIPAPPGDSISAPPTQQTRDVYTAIWNHVEIESADVGGDIPALMRIRSAGKTDQILSNNGLTFAQQQIYIGTRSVSRGADFRSIWPISQYSQYVGAASAIAAVDTSWQAELAAPAGQVARYNPGAAAVEVMEISYLFGGAAGGADPAYPFQDQMVGEYHMFLRYRIVAGATGVANVRAKIGAVDGGFTQITDYHDVTVPITDPDNQWHLMDFGRVHLGMDTISPHDYETRQIGVYFFLTATGACDVQFDSLILLPIDETFAVMTASRSQTTIGSISLTLGSYLDADSITHERGTLSLARIIPPMPSQNEVLAGWTINANTDLWLQANAGQTIHFLTENHFWDGAVHTNPVASSPFSGMAIRVDKCNRYLSMRGTG